MSIRNIAQLVKLSTATVSLALRDSPKIPLETRQRIKAVASKHGYLVDPRVTRMMSLIRLTSRAENQECFGVISFYNTPRPWEDSVHLARMYDGMKKRAGDFGYRLEPMWLRAPEMTPKRFGNILDTRGIEGLLCMGSPNVDERIPSELTQCAIVTQGLSIKADLHRVANNAYSDTQRVLNRLYKIGYRRPGLVVSQYEHERGGHANVSSYLGWCHHALRNPTLVPVLHVNGVEEKLFLEWVQNSQPDVIVLVHRREVVADFCALLRRNGIGIPKDIGVAVLSQTLEGSEFSGMAEDQATMGAWAVELLVSRIMNRDFGLPKRPRIELVDGIWEDGKSLRQR